MAQVIGAMIAVGSATATAAFLTLCAFGQEASDRLLRALQLTLLLSTLVIMCGLAAGCGGTMVSNGARGVETAGRLLGPAMDWAHDARAAALETCVAPSTPMDCESRQMAQWDPLRDALNATRDALAAVLDGLELAHIHDVNAPTGEQIVALARVAFDAWTTAFDLAHAMGHTLPSLPQEVLALIGGST